MLEINNRRYIGSKFKLLPQIRKVIETYYRDNNFIFADLFAGTGVVAHSFARNGCSVIVNDILYSNVVIYNAWLSREQYRPQIIKETINCLNRIEDKDISENYFSQIYGGKYFSNDCAKRIGYIRDFLEDNKETFTEREYFILLTSLLYAADRVANTVGHFESYLKKKPKKENFFLQELDIQPVGETRIYNMDANVLARQIQADVVYVDPPYNSRQYVNFYHVLENLARWNKPTEFEGESMKFKRDQLKSGYSRAEAPFLFKELIENLNCKIIIVSYNNTYSAQSVASINKIQENNIINVLSKKGKVSSYSFDYKSFNAGKTDLKGHKEFLYVCEVGK